MLYLLQIASLVLAGIIAGGAWAYTLEIHPALLKAPPRSSLDIFLPMFKHANRVQPLLGGTLGIITLVVSILSGNWYWLMAGLVMQLIGPYTIFGMMPLNRRLMAPDADPNSPALVADLKHWGKLHFVRTLINSVVFVTLCCLFAR